MYRPDKGIPKVNRPGDVLLDKLHHDIQQWRLACALLPPALRTPSLISALLDTVRRPSPEVRRAIKAVERTASRLELAAARDRRVQGELFDTRF